MHHLEWIMTGGFFGLVGLTFLRLLAVERERAVVQADAEVEAERAQRRAQARAEAEAMMKDSDVALV